MWLIVVDVLLGYELLHVFNVQFIATTITFLTVKRYYILLTHTPITYCFLLYVYKPKFSAICCRQLNDDLFKIQLNKKLFIYKANVNFFQFSFYLRFFFVSKNFQIFFYSRELRLFIELIGKVLNLMKKKNLRKFPF